MMGFNAANLLTFEQTVQADYTLGREVQQDAYHISIIRNTLTKNIGARFLEIMDEIMSSFGDVIPATDGASNPCKFS